MNSSQFSANNWPGPWNPVSLPNRKYYRLRSTKPRTPSSEDAESSLLAIGTREVDEIKQADFIVVDDDIQPNDGAYASLLTYAERNHIAIVTVADIKHGIGIFPAYIAALPEIRRQKSSPIKKPVQENWVDGQFGLIFGEEVVKYCKNNKNWAEAIQYEILLRDPIVREFIRHPR
ncbi:hypothetical protein BC938DRAFT_477666 [Jimgerdemannia flammicorona]|uniref:Uncharacterized protein n=1 Tax=Jimgerdemannia flammicorona TaxID=994334 RepID=A0A433QP13_9FUNG|nr:hypothetical protein BC938DRAFT_477666 [Jimgerdemannia flammicorona]